MIYGTSNAMNYITYFLVVGFIVFYFMNQFGLMGNFAITDYDYQETKNLIDVCENEHKELIETQLELNELKSLDIYRAYDEARQDYRDLREKRNFVSYMFFITTILGVALSWFITSEYYRKKGKKKK